MTNTITSPAATESTFAWLPASRIDRQRQLAELLVHSENGRLARTIVNRLWARLFGRGLVEPLDNMDAEPWHQDLLDYLAADLADHGYDLKHTLRLLANSRAYQLPATGESRSEGLGCGHGRAKGVP